jgi:formate dehydrogenase subunit gamma
MTKRARPQQILRFRESERHVHWAIAIPFLICYATGVALFVFYNADPQRPFRSVVSWSHRLSGVCLILLPLLAVVRGRGEFRIHLDNVVEALTWTLDDLRWLALAGVAAVDKNVTLPEQGKFNAAEKLNFMTQVGSYPLYIVSGLIIWMTDGAFLPWIIHILMTVMVTPLILGHIYMATVNPSSRAGLSGMISGFVDRRWAKHHYGKWYRGTFEGGESRSPIPNEAGVDVAEADRSSCMSRGHRLQLRGAEICRVEERRPAYGRPHRDPFSGSADRPARPIRASHEPVIRDPAGSARPGSGGNVLGRDRSGDPESSAESSR